MIDEKRVDFPLLAQFFPQGVVAIDLEMTGLSPLNDHIIEIAAIKVLPRGSQVLVFEQLISPPVPILNSEIHGITDQMVAKMPSLEESIPKFFQFTKELPLIAHNAKFDIGYLVAASHKLELPLPASPIFCSCQLSRITFREQKSHRLVDLAANLMIPLEGHHRACGDAFASLLIFQAALKKLQFDGKGDDYYLQSRYCHLSDFSPEKSDMNLPPHLFSLYDYTPRQEIIEIRYRGGKRKNSLRPVRPIALLPMPEGNIMYAHCLESDLYKSYILDKITEVKSLPSASVQKWEELLKKRAKER